MFYHMDKSLVIFLSLISLNISIVHCKIDLERIILVLL